MPFVPDEHDPAVVDLDATSGSSTSARSRASAGFCAATARRCPANSLARRDRARLARRLPVRREGVARARTPARSGWWSPRTAAGDPGFALFSGNGGTISDLDGARLRDAMAGAGGAVQVRFTRDLLEVRHDLGGRPDELLGRRPDAVRAQRSSRTSARRARTSSPRRCPSTRAIRSSISPARASRRRTSRARRRCCSSAIRRWTPKQVKSALMSTAGPTFADSGADAGGVRPRPGRRARPRRQRPTTRCVFTDPQSLSFGYLDVNAGAASRAIPVTVSDAGGGAGTWTAEVAATGRLERRDASSAAPFTARARRDASSCRWSRTRPRARRRATTSASSSSGAATTSAASRTRSRSRARSSGTRRSSRCDARQTGDTRERDGPRARLPLADVAVRGSSSIFGVDPSVNEDGQREGVLARHPAAGGQRGRRDRAAGD